MKVSIITVTYNSEKYLETCIRSVLSQTYHDIEYIIIDGSSKDGTKDIIERYKDKLAISISEPDHGIYDAMSKGIKSATGDIIGILNSDDLFENNQVVSTIVKEFEQDRALEIVYGDLLYVLPDSTQTVKRRWISLPYYDKFFDEGHVPPHPTLYLKKGVYQKAGLFNLDYRLAADYEFMLRVFKKHHLRSKYISQYLVRMRLGGATNKNAGNIIKGNTEILRAWKANGLTAPISLMPKRLYRRLIQFI